MNLLTFKKEENYFLNEYKFSCILIDSNFEEYSEFHIKLFMMLKLYNTNYFIKLEKIMIFPEKSCFITKKYNNKLKIFFKKCDYITQINKFHLNKIEEEKEKRKSKFDEIKNIKKKLIKKEEIWNLKKNEVKNNKLIDFKKKIKELKKKNEKVIEDDNLSFKGDNKKSFINFEQYDKEMDNFFLFDDSKKLFKILNQILKSINFAFENNILLNNINIDLIKINNFENIIIEDFSKSIIINKYTIEKLNKKKDEKLNNNNFFKNRNCKYDDYLNFANLIFYLKYRKNLFDFNNLEEFNKKKFEETLYYKSLYLNKISSYIEYFKYNRLEEIKDNMHIDNYINYFLKFSLYKAKNIFN